MTDIDYSGDLELHVKYNGEWLMKTGKQNVQSKDIIQAIEELSLVLQRAIDTTTQGRPEKNIVGARFDNADEGFKDEGFKDE